MTGDKIATGAADEGENVLGRWSRLKGEQLAAQEGAVGATLETAPVAEEAPPPEPPLELPSVEEMDGASDFTVFLRDGVPEDLRRLALRKLWRSDPVLANLDGLNEYDEDYSIIKPLAAAAVEALKKELWRDKTESPQDTTPQDNEETADIVEASPTNLEDEATRTGIVDEDEEPLADKYDDDGELG